MKALVIGQGGREHALVRALKFSPSISEVHALPGSDGIAQDAICHKIDWQDFAAVVAVAEKTAIDFVVIGPDAAVVAGLADALRTQGIAVVGPSSEAAQLEGSKIYCKKFLIDSGIPTARADIVESVAEVRSAMKTYQPPYVLKADGLAAGKGVFICKDEVELLKHSADIFENHTLGTAGNKALLEEFQPGFEISYLVLTNGESFEPLPLAQDHKRLLNGDKGPNTGGMGVVAPVSLDSALKEQIDREIIQPTIDNLKKCSFLYRGVLFVGLMMTDNGPSVLEFNVRFGDPETQVLLPLLDGDWGQVFQHLAQGELQPLKWKNLASACVVLAAEGYPDAPVKGVAIHGIEAGNESSYLLHAGTQKTKNDGWVTSGGRVLNAIGIAPALTEAVSRAYAQASHITWPGVQKRSDIGAKIL